MKKKKVAIINYGMGNLRSVEVSLNHLGIQNNVISSPDKLIGFSHMILPGVGSFKKAIFFFSGRDCKRSDQSLKTL